MGTIIILILMALILYIAMKYLRGPRNENTGSGGFVQRPYGIGGEEAEDSACKEQDICEERDTCEED